MAILYCNSVWNLVDGHIWRSRTALACKLANHCTGEHLTIVNVYLLHTGSLKLKSDSFQRVNPSRFGLAAGHLQDSLPVASTTGELH